MEEIESGLVLKCKEEKIAQAVNSKSELEAK
jgi:hypothetical protein